MIEVHNAKITDSLSTKKEKKFTIDFKIDPTENLTL